MNVRNVVKVMNFHALLRVDKSKKEANKYQYMENQLLDMIDGIVNNRNFQLDKKAMRVNKKAPELTIYMGSDFGFCSNFNAGINDQIRTDTDTYKIIIGKKLHAIDNEHLLFRMENEVFRQDMRKVQSTIVSAIKNLEYSKINIVYNHYVNTTDIQLCKKQLFPVETVEKRRHQEDFVVEGNLNRLLENLIISYVNYEVMLSLVFSSAAENLMRQNATTDSLKRIDEMEEEYRKQELRERREKEFNKVIDNFVKVKTRK